VSWNEAIIAFVSLFVGALLAFYLESLRERRATRRWVWEYLGFWRELMESFAEQKAVNLGLFDSVDAALGRLLPADDAAADGAADAAADTDWEAVDGLLFNSAISLSPSLLGEASAVVPADLMRSMVVVDAVVQHVKASSETTYSLYESLVRPLVLRRDWPMSAEQRRALALYRRDLALLRALIESLYDQLADLAKQMRAAGI